MKGHIQRNSPGLLARGAIALVRCYQWSFSRLKPPTCRYYPTCSEYAAQAIAARGLLRGSLLALWRLLRCHPFSPGGYDPVPSAGEPAAGDPAAGEPGAGEPGTEEPS